MIHAIALIAASAFLAGCGATKYVQTQVPVPVECKEQMPVRPAMPTEALAPGVAPWVLLRAALAEIDRREGYELVMRAALAACTDSINPIRPDAGNTTGEQP